VFPCALDAIFLGPLPNWIANTPEGQKFWCTIFAFAILLPMSMPRQLSALRIATILSFACVCFVIVTLVMECILNRQVNPDLDQSIVAAALKVNFNTKAILSAFPIMIFSYMYQPNVP
jgi:amino acid permease